MNLFYVMVILLSNWSVESHNSTKDLQISEFPLPLDLNMRRGFVCRPQKIHQPIGEANELSDWFIRRYRLALEYNNARQSCCLLDVADVVLRACINANRRFVLDNFCEAELRRDPDRRHACCYSLSSQRYLCFERYKPDNSLVTRTTTSKDATAVPTQALVDKICVKLAIFHAEKFTKNLLVEIDGIHLNTGINFDYCCRLHGRYSLSCFQVQLREQQQVLCETTHHVCCDVEGEHRYRCFLERMVVRSANFGRTKADDFQTIPNYNLSGDNISSDIKENVFGIEKTDIEESDVMEESDDDIEVSDVMGANADEIEESDDMGANDDDIEESDVMGTNDDDIEESDVMGANADDIEESGDIEEYIPTTKDVITQELRKNAKESLKEDRKLFIKKKAKAHKNYNVSRENASSTGENRRLNHKKRRQHWVRLKNKNNMGRKCCLVGRVHYAKTNTCGMGKAVQYTREMKVIRRRQACALAYYRCCKRLLERQA